MADYGRQTFGNTGVPIEVAASGPPEWMPAGITISWAAVTAVSVDTVTSPAENLTVPSGQKYLRYGQVLCRITDKQAYSVTLTNTPTSGSYTLVGYQPNLGGRLESAVIAFDATAATMQATLRTAFPGVPVTVSGSVSGPYTVTSPIVGLAAGTSTMAGAGATPAVVIVNTVATGESGKYGPYDSAASDGRQTLTRGQCCILNTTTLQNGIIPAFTNLATDHPGALVGGHVWCDRLLMTSGTHSLAVGPTFTEALLVFPRLTLVGSPPSI